MGAVAFINKIGEKQMALNDQKTFDRSQFKLPLVMLAIFWLIAVLLWQVTGPLIFNRGWCG